MLSTFLKDGKLVDFLTGPGIHAQEKKRIDLENELKTLHHINQLQEADHNYYKAISESKSEIQTKEIKSYQERLRKSQGETETKIFKLQKEINELKEKNTRASVLNLDFEKQQQSIYISSLKKRELEFQNLLVKKEEEKKDLQKNHEREQKRIKDFLEDAKAKEEKCSSDCQEKIKENKKLQEMLEKFKKNANDTLTIKQETNADLKNEIEFFEFKKKNDQKKIQETEKAVQELDKERWLLQNELQTEKTKISLLQAELKKFQYERLSNSQNLQLEKKKVLEFTLKQKKTESEYEKKKKESETCAKELIEAKQTIKNLSPKEIIDTNSVQSKKGRPVFTGDTTLMIVHDIPNMPKTLDRLKEILADAQIMFDACEKGAYMFQEYWFKRKKNTAITDELKESEIEAIINGNPSKFGTEFYNLPLIRKIKKKEKETEYKFKLKDTNIIHKHRFPEVTLEKLDGFVGIEAIPFKIDQIGIDGSRPFKLPTIFSEDNLTIFINHFNELMAGKQPADPKDLVESYGAFKAPMRKELIKEWTTLLNTIPKNDDLSKWTAEIHFDVNLIFNHTAQFCSCFSWWGSTLSDLQAINGLESEDTDYVSFRDNKILVSRAILVSFAETKRKNCWELNTSHPLDLLRTEPIRKIEVNKSNLYHLLAKTGCQQVELTNLSSTLGSACHNAVAVMLLNGKPTLPNGIENWSALNIYLTQLPPIINDIAKLFYDKLKDSIVAVEFPVYDFKETTQVDGIKFSRIDAITKDYNDGNGVAYPGYAIWEFKTRWGKVANFKTKAEKDDLAQAVYYREIFKKMTGNKVEHIFIAYAHVTNDYNNMNSGKSQISLHVHYYKLLKNKNYITYL